MAVIGPPEKNRIRSHNDTSGGTADVSPFIRQTRYFRRQTELGQRAPKNSEIDRKLSQSISANRGGALRFDRTELGLSTDALWFLDTTLASSSQIAVARDDFFNEQDHIVFDQIGAAEQRVIGRARPINIPSEESGSHRTVGVPIVCCD